MKFRIIYCLFFFVTMLSGCKKWPTTEDISHDSQLPVFTLEGGEFLVYEPIDSGKFEDPGVTATSNGKENKVYYSGEVDLTKIGVYVVRYVAENADGLVNSTQRIVAVRDVNVLKNDLSGTYTGTYWDQVESKVKKIDPRGFYQVEDVLGYPGAKMPGKFVDMGDNKLVLVNGEGDFGRYGLYTKGSYSRKTLSWTVNLLDPPYETVSLPVTWQKKD